MNGVGLNGGLTPGSTSLNGLMITNSWGCKIPQDYNGVSLNGGHQDWMGDHKVITFPPTRGDITSPTGLSHCHVDNFTPNSWGYKIPHHKLINNLLTMTPCHVDNFILNKLINNWIVNNYSHQKVINIPWHCHLSNQGGYLIILICFIRWGGDSSLYGGWGMSFVVSLLPGWGLKHVI